MASSLLINQQQFFLPFVQIYLDRFYVADYQRTYGNSSMQIDSTQVGTMGYPPIEFEIPEIKDFGYIDEVLRNYLLGVIEEILGMDRSIMYFLKRTRS